MHADVQLKGSAKLMPSDFRLIARSVKKVALKLVESFVEKAEDPSIVASAYVPAMMDPILGDYLRAVPDARCAGLQCGPEGAREHQGQAHPER